MPEPAGGVVDRYLELGLRLGRHVDGLVDAYYGPPAAATRVAAEPPRAPAALADDARRLLADLAAGAGGLEPGRRRWLAAQVQGLRTTALKLAGADIGYADEVVPGTGPLAERYAAWREAQVVPVDRLQAAVASLAEDLRERTVRLFGLPDGEHVDFDLVRDKPWAGFNYYLGDLRSRVVVNIDLPVLSLSIGHLVAHEAYPGHHTEHCRKEVGLVRARRRLEETIFLVGTPQCLVAEGLADLGLEVVAGPRPEPVVAEHLRPLGVPYDAEGAAAVAGAADVLGRVRGNAALLLHEDGADGDDVVEYLGRWALLPRPRAAKMVEFLTDATWRAYMTCYVEGLRLCRTFVDGDPGRFERLITEQVVPADLAA